MYTRSTSWLILVTIALITILLGYQAARSRFDYDFEKFFPKENEDTRLFEKFRNEFENDYDFLLIGIENSGGIFRPDFLQKIEHLRDTLAALKDVRAVYSPTDLRLPVVQGIGLGYKKVLRTGNRDELVKDSVAIYETGEFVGSFFARDGTSLCLVLETREKMSKKASDVLLFSIEKVLEHEQFDHVHLAGKIKAQYVYLNRMQKEIILFLSAAILLVMILLAISFQSFWHVTFPLLVVLFSIVWQIGIMHLLGKNIDVLTTLLPTILFVVGMSDVIHILSKYIEELRNGKQKTDAIRITVKEIGWATFLTSFTTALGFFSLTLSNIQPIREFGLYTSLGVMIAFVLAFTVLPSLLVILPEPQIARKEERGIFWRKFLRRRYAFILRHPKLIIGTFAIITLISSAGILRLKVNNFLLEDLRPHEPLKQEFNWFEEHYSGGRPLELLATVKSEENDVFSYETVQQLSILEKGIEKHFHAGFIQSPLMQVRFFNRGMNSGKNQYFKLPETREKHERLIIDMKKSGILDQPEAQRFFTSDLRTARFSAKMKDAGSYAVNKMEKTFIDEMNMTLDTGIISYQLTGSSRLVDKNISYLSVSLIKGLSLAFVIIALLFGTLFRSIRMIFIALIPNIIPLVVIAGIMGFTGIDIKVSTSIVFTIAFGIAVDDTIHFLSRYRIERKSGKSNLYALKRSYVSTGKAIILTSVILCAGFISMITSSFLSVFYIGLLISLTLLLALLADLFLLPALLMGRKR